MKIYIIHTGGTIGMKPNEDGELVTVKGALREFVKENKEIQDLVADREIKIEFKEYEDLIDSSIIEPKHWSEIIDDISENYVKYDGIVIIHGTDTMAYSSSVISFFLENVSKPIVFTGSQLSVFEEGSDGVDNLLNAIRVASGEGEVREVCIVFDTAIVRGSRATKISAIQKHAFTSPSSKLLGTINEGKIETVKKRFLKKSDASFIANKLDPNNDINVIVVKLFPAFNPGIFASLTKDGNIKAVVIEAYGQGNTADTDEFEKALASLKDKEIVVVIISQPLHGMVKFGNYEASNVFKKNGAISGYDLTTEAAVSKLYYLFNKGKSFSDVITEFRKSLRGELNSSNRYYPSLLVTHIDKENLGTLLLNAPHLDPNIYTSKTVIISYLFSKMERAIYHLNYFEAIHIAEKLIDDRVNSLLEKTFLIPNNDAPFEEKVKTITDNWDLISGKYLGIEIINSVLEWHIDINFNILHANRIFQTPLLSTEENENLQMLAKQGRDISRNLSAAVMRWKKYRNKKMKIIHK